jgi:hypothetical protein
VIFLLCRAGDEPVRRPLINGCGCGFNPPGIAAAHNTTKDCGTIVKITGHIPPASRAANSQTSVNSAKNALNLFSPPQTPFLRGLSPVYRRADLWRTFVPVVALLITAVSTGAFAREFLVSGPQGERHSIEAFRSRHFAAEKEPLEHIKTGATDLNRTMVALIETVPPVLIARLGRVE